MELEQEEIVYLDGGEYLSKSQCANMLASVGMNPYSYIAGAVGVLAAAKLVAFAANFGGPVAWIAKFVVGIAGAQAYAFGWAVANGAIKNGVDITWNWMPGRDIGVNYTIYN